MSHLDPSLRHVTALNDLIAAHPHLPMQLVHDVLQAHHYDHKLAYETLCEMLIPADPLSSPVSSKSATPQHSAVTYLPPNPAASLSTSAPSVARPPRPQGVWAHNNIGRRYQLDALCDKYHWMPRARIQRLLDAYHGCIELVEEDILHMFPVDQPQAFGSGNAHSASSHADITREQAIAESLRQKDAAEMRDHSGAASADTGASALVQLRRQLWQQRKLLSEANVLACNTRKPAHHKRAKEIEHDVNSLSAHFLDRLRRSDEYKKGVIDLHGLTKEEAIQLVEWKLVDSGRRRFRVITGKGIHSHNEQAVLRPALEKHFRSKGISFTRYQDGVLTVIPR